MRIKWGISVLLLCYGLLLLRTALAWSAALDPFSLWHDDVWVAVLTKCHSLKELLSLKTPAPPAFTAALMGMSRLVADPEVSMQIIPFAAGLTGVLAMGLLVQRLTGDRWLGLFGAAMAALNVPLATYALRVKHYSLDFLATTLILILAVQCFRKPSKHAALALALFGIAAYTFSFTSAFVSAPAVALALWSAKDLWRTHRREFAAIAGSAVFYGAMMAVLFFTDARLRTSSGMVNFWHDFFPATAAGAPWRALLKNGTAAFTQALPEFLSWAGWLAVPGIVGLLWTRDTPRFGVLAILFYAVIVVANLSMIYPLGKDRLDIFSTPVTLCLVCGGAWTLARRLPARPAITCLTAAAALVIALANPVHPLYPFADSATIVRELEKNIRPGDPLIIHPSANHAVAYYGHWPLVFDKSTDDAILFEAEIQREHLLLPGEREGDPTRGIPQFLEQGHFKRLYLVSFVFYREWFPPTYETDKEIMRILDDDGWKIASKADTGQYRLFRMEKR